MLEVTKLAGLLAWRAGVRGTSEKLPRRFP